MDAFQTSLKYSINWQAAKNYSFVVLLTMGGEHVLSLVAFRCPCSNESFRYGLVFLFSPALVLLVIGYFLNSKTWKLFTGCWVNPRKIFPRGNGCHFFYVFGEITLHALVAPVMWLSVALLNGTFYECAMSGLKNPAYFHTVCHSKSEKCFEELHKVPCDKSSLPFPESDELKRTLQAQSQTSNGALLSSPLLSLLITCCASCQSKVSHLQLMFWKANKGADKEQLERIFLLQAAKLNKRNLKCFLENKEPEALSLPAFHAWEDATHIYSFSS
ncbi:CAHM5 protein, partial [Donacobius atricapilla]|nr:CAHM5 protein [Donacobius atricapilla]